MGAYGLIQGSVEDSAVLGTYCRTKTWRPAFAEFFNGFFGNQERGVFIDVGANIGLTIIPVVRDAHIRCFGFEPDPTNFRYLRNNVQLNCPRRKCAAVRFGAVRQPPAAWIFNCPSPTREIIVSIEIRQTACRENSSGKSSGSRQRASMTCSCLVWATMTRL